MPWRAASALRARRQRAHTVHQARRVAHVGSAERVQPQELERRSGGADRPGQQQPVHRLVHLVRRQPELARPRTADDGRRFLGAVPAPSMARRSSSPWRGAATGRQLHDHLELLERLDGERPDAGPDRPGDLGIGLAGAGEHDLAQVEAGPGDRIELAHRGHVRAQPEAGEVGQQRGIGVRLDREGHLPVGGERGPQRRDPRRHHLQVVHEQRRAVGAHQVGRVHAGDPGSELDGRVRHRSASSSATRASVDASRRLTMTGTCEADAVRWTPTRPAPVGCRAPPPNPAG